MNKPVNSNVEILAVPNEKDFAAALQIENPRLQMLLDSAEIVFDEWVNTENRLHSDLCAMLSKCCKNANELAFIVATVFADMAGRQNGYMSGNLLGDKVVPIQLLSIDTFEQMYDHAQEVKNRGRKNRGNSGK